MERSIGKGRQVGDRWILASGVNNLGEYARIQEEWEAAETHYEESKTLFESVASAPDVARADFS
nr:hypothetical protein [Anaerolineae bacterium]